MKQRKLRMRTRKNRKRRVVAEYLLAEQDARYKPDLNAFHVFFAKEAISASTAGARPVATW